MQVKRLILVRHGADEVSVTGERVLSTTGRGQALGVASWLAGATSAGRLITSSMPRALQTAEVISAVTGQVIEHDSRLNEVAAGDSIPRLRTDGAPGEEGWSEFISRVRSFWLDFKASPGRDILAVTHSGVFDALFTLITTSSAVELKIDNGAVSVWVFRPGDPEGEWLLEGHNLRPCEQRNGRV